jgi:AraC-like DNA-binding protein
VLSYPSLHIVFEAGQASVVGVVRGKFSRTLHGRGQVFGIKLRPAMSGRWLRLPASHWTDKTAPLAEARSALWLAGESLARPSCVAPLAEGLALDTDPLRAAELVEAWLDAAPPYDDPQATQIRDLVSLIAADSALTHVDQITALAGIPMRQLQRQFQKHVGVTPKWVVQRFRLQQAAEQLERGAETIASVAASVGYFDQAHFVRDFKRVVGWTPSEHVRRARARSV